MRNLYKTAAIALLILLQLPVSAQKYQGGLIDKSIAVVGNEMITISDLEQEIQMMKSQGYASDKNIRCEILEQMMESKLFLMQARIDSLTLNQDQVQAQLTQRMDQVRTALGGDDPVCAYGTGRQGNAGDEDNARTPVRAQSRLE